HLRHTSLGENPKLKSKKQRHVSDIIKPVVPLKYATVQNEYNQLILTFKDNYAVEFRAFNDGVAYRFIIDQSGEVEVLSEDVALHFPSPYLAHLQQPGGFKTSYEDLYTHVATAEWKPTDKMATLPVLIDTKKAYKILISEADLTDYPALFFRGTENNGMQAVFPKVP